LVAKTNIPADRTNQYLDADIAPALDGTVTTMILKSRTPEPTQSLQVLVAEDGLVNRRLAHGLLTREGHQVTLADNGAQALSQLRRARYDVVLMDVDMPVMNGLAATVALRRHERKTGQYTPVIALTSNANRDECLAAGMDAFLSKPLNIDAFRNVVAEVIRDSAA
jgi:two-component system, sensor histidine kinase and response regulator